VRLPTSGGVERRAVEGDPAGLVDGRDRGVELAQVGVAQEEQVSGYAAILAGSPARPRARR
jgi:hypothetical protein